MSAKVGNDKGPDNAELPCFSMLSQGHLLLIIVSLLNGIYLNKSCPN